MRISREMVVTYMFFPWPSCLFIRWEANAWMKNSYVTNTEKGFPRLIIRQALMSCVFHLILFG
jgi:hypothetical protein